MIIQQSFTINYQIRKKKNFGGINSNIKFCSIIAKFDFVSYFLIGFRKEFSYKSSLDKADVLNIYLTKPT